MPSAIGSVVRRFALIALFPPGNVSGLLSAVQDLLYGERANVCALALPPMLPLVAVPGEASAQRFRQALTPPPVGWRIDTGPAFLSGRALYAGVETSGGSGRLEALRRRLAESGFAGGPDAAPPAGDAGVRPTIAEPLPFALADGFLLSGDAGDIAPLPDVPRIGFGVFEIGLLVVRCADPPARWWEEVGWEIEAAVRTRRGR